MPDKQILVFQGKGFQVPVPLCIQRSDKKFKYIFIFSQNFSVCEESTHLPPEQNGCHFPDDIFKNIFINEMFCILIRISLKFALKGPINNTVLVQVMAWHRTGDQCWPSSSMHIYGTRGRWVNRVSYYTGRALQPGKSPPVMAVGLTNHMWSLGHFSQHPAHDESWLNIPA